MRKRWLSFLFSVMVIALVWLILLPWLGSVPSIRHRIDEDKARGINPDAMFYTELEAMGRILARFER